MQARPEEVRQHQWIEFSHFRIFSNVYFKIAILNENQIKIANFSLKCAKCPLCFVKNGILAILIRRHCSIELSLINISEAKQSAYKMSDRSRLPRFEGWVPCQGCFPRGKIRILGIWVLGQPRLYILSKLLGGRRKFWKHKYGFLGRRRILWERERALEK